VKHDDQVDAFSLMVGNFKLIKQAKNGNIIGMASSVY